MTPSLKILLVVLKFNLTGVVLYVFISKLSPSHFLLSTTLSSPYEKNSEINNICFKKCSLNFACFCLKPDVPQNSEEAARLQQLQAAAAQWQQVQQQRASIQYQALMQQHEKLQQILEQYQQLIQQPSDLQVHKYLSSNTTFKCNSTVIDFCVFH